MVKGFRFWSRKSKSRVLKGLGYNHIQFLAKKNLKVILGCENATRVTTHYHRYTILIESLVIDKL